jgi:uncharacterized protein YaiL (DUF2058 family)
MRTVLAAPFPKTRHKNSFIDMSESLKDQLRALGLAPKQQKRSQTKSSRPKKPGAHKAATREKGSGNPEGGADISLDQAYRIRSRQERQQKEQAAARKREQERLRRETNQKIKILIREHAVRDKAADTKRNFLYKGRIRSVLTTPEQLRDINDGKLGVVYLSGNYHLMPFEKIEEVRAFAPDHVPDLSGAESKGEEEFPVPDDLIW